MTILRRILCMNQLSFYYGPFRVFKVAHRKSTKTLETLYGRLEHIDGVRRLREPGACYEKYYREHPECKARRGSGLSYSEEYKQRVVIEGAEIESYFGPSPPDP